MYADDCKLCSSDPCVCHSSENLESSSRGGTPEGGLSPKPQDSPEPPRKLQRGVKEPLAKVFYDEDQDPEVVVANLQHYLGDECGLSLIDQITICRSWANHLSSLIRPKKYHKTK
jgi:hypothetical protein